MGKLSKDEMRAGLSAGRTLIQEEWAASSEIAAVDELVAEGFAAATAWAYVDGFQCERRTVRLAPPSLTQDPS